MTLVDILRTAVFALRGNWMRSALTSLGVIIGLLGSGVVLSLVKAARDTATPANDRALLP